MDGCGLATAEKKAAGVTMHMANMCTCALRSGGRKEGRWGKLRVESCGRTGAGNMLWVEGHGREAAEGMLRGGRLRKDGRTRHTVALTQQEANCGCATVGGRLWADNC